MLMFQLMVAAAIRKSVPRLKWVRLREKITTPVSGFVFRGVEGRVLCACARRVVRFVGVGVDVGVGVGVGVWKVHVLSACL